jgi:sugar phosphate isomerase/epimerase
MKISVSNIAWENDQFDNHIKFLGDLQCDGIELATSCIWPEPVEATEEERKTLKKKINQQGLVVVGIHSLFFTRRDLQLFGTDESRRQMAEYLVQLFKLCHDLGGKTLVFGSPGNRKRNGRSYEECIKIAVDFFKSVMPAAQESDVYLCVEPLSKEEADFIQSTAEAYDLVQKVNHTHFTLHLDAKAMLISKENPDDVRIKFGKAAKHCHVGDPDLAPPGSTGADHKPIGDALRDSGYDGYVSIEMRRGFGPSKDVIRKSVEYVRKTYHIKK